MNWDSVSFDWNQARAFLATAEEGSFSAAARALGLAQPTLSRQVAALEDDLGVLLFERIGRSIELTHIGQGLVEYVREMGAAAARVSINAAGHTQSPEGLVTVTATNTMATLHLPPIIEAIRRKAPGIELRIVVSNDVRDLTRREADIAIRHGQPDQPDLVAKLIGESQASLYATKTYFDKHGRPTTVKDLATATFIGFETSETMLPILIDAGLLLTRANFPISTGNGVALIEYVRQGLGISVLAKEDAEQFPDLIPVLPGAAAFPVPVWLVVHRELRTSLRYRIVFDEIAKGLSKRLSVKR